MDAPSSAPLSRKLGIKPGHRLALVDPPPDFLRLLAPMPAGVCVEPEDDEPVDVIVLFCRSRAEMESGFAPLAVRLTPAGGLWVAWPKKSSGVETDLSSDVVQAFGLRGGLVDNKVCSIDATW